MENEVNIYWAASLHDPHEQGRNRREVTKLRAAGFTVYMPQEHGIWEDMVNEERAKDPSRRESEIIAQVRARLYIEDKVAIDECDFVVAYVDRHPSEGTLWEMGYAVGIDRIVVLVNACDWKFNLMPEFGSHVVKTTEEAINYIICEGL